MEKKPRIYGWEKQQNLLVTLSLVEAIRRGEKLPEIRVFMAKELYSSSSSSSSSSSGSSSSIDSFSEQDLILSNIHFQKQKVLGDSYRVVVDGGHHRALAYEITDTFPSYRVIEGCLSDTPFSQMQWIGQDSVVYSITLNNSIISFKNKILRDSKYIDITKIDEYKPIIEIFEERSKPTGDWPYKRYEMKAEDLKKLVRQHIRF